MWWSTLSPAERAELAADLAAAPPSEHAALLADWQATAAVLADPALTARLLADVDEAEMVLLTRPGETGGR